MATIQSIVYQPKNQKYEEDHNDDFIRVPVREIELVENLGLKGDRKGRKDSKRQVNLLSVEWLNQKQAEGYQIGPGQFGEQLVINGLAVESLQPGDMLELGETACLEITKPRIGCDRLEAAQGKNGLADTEVGMLARVVQNGLIQVGDEVFLRPRVTLNPL